MPNFPPGCTMILRPSQWYSLNGTPSGPAPWSDDYPLEMLNDGSARRAFRSTVTSGFISIDLGAALSPNLLGIINHTFDRGLIVGVQASSSSGFGSLLLDQGISTRFPGMWLDLRGFGVTARYWRILWTGNSRPVAVGEFVIGLADIYEGCIAPEWEEGLATLAERFPFESYRSYASFTGQVARTTQLDFTFTDAELANMQALYDECGPSNSKYVLVPDSLRNDIWIAEIPSNREIVAPVSEVEFTHSLAVVEEGMGVLR